MGASQPRTSVPFVDATASARRTSRMPIRRRGNANTCSKAVRHSDVGEALLIASPGRHFRSLRAGLSRLDPIVFAEVTGPAAGTALIFLIVRVGDPSAKSAIAQYPARPDVIVDDYFVARNDFRDQGEIDFAHLTLSSRKRRIAADLLFTPHMIEIAPTLRPLSLVKHIDFDRCARLRVLRYLQPPF
jgi:hypothetical protein